MPRFKNLEQLVEDIQSGLVKLRAGELEPDALDPLVHDARALSNRLLILRYKTREFVYTERPDAAVERPANPLTPKQVFRIGAAYQTSLIDAIEAVAKDRLDGPSEQVSLFDDDPTFEPAPAPAPAPAPEPAPAPSPVPATKHSPASESAAAPVPVEEPTLVATLEQRPIDDLRTAFGIAEKYQFIQELFNNDAIAFSNALDALDDAGSIEVAEAWLSQHLTSFNDWDQEEQPMARFMEVVKRRFL
jgi:hypothetical protein